MTVELPVLSCQLPNFKAKADQEHLTSKKCGLKLGMQYCKYAICMGAVIYNSWKFCI